MAYRGRGRGRGSYGYASKQEPFELYPPGVKLPDKKESSIDDRRLVQLNLKFQFYYKDSPYFLDETLAKNEESVDIKRYSDKVKKRSISKIESISDCGCIKLEPGYFPVELVRGRKQRIGRKVKWNPNKDLKKLDMLEVLEEKFKDDDPTSKRKKDGDDDNDDDDSEEDPEDELDEDDDSEYERNKDFDDDEDDYNAVDSGGEEDIL